MAIRFSSFEYYKTNLIALQENNNNNNNNNNTITTTNTNASSSVIFVGIINIIYISGFISWNNRISISSYSNGIN